MAVERRRLPHIYPAGMAQFIVGTFTAVSPKALPPPSVEAGVPPPR